MERWLPADAGDRRWRILGSALLLAFAAAGAVDLVLDGPGRGLHTVVEATMLGLALACVAALWLHAGRARSAGRRARAEADAQRAERDAWRARSEELLRGLGAAIDAQLRAWRLTPAERETALLLLKGYGHKEIAALCARSERTVRQHAVAVYRKAGLSGRAELAAYFLEDLLLPSEPA